MGELSKRDANQRREKYQEKLMSYKKYVRENFEEMDFENSQHRDSVEGYVERIESHLDWLNWYLSTFTFE